MRTKIADVRFYFDADIVGLARVVCGLRSDCTYPDDPGKTIKRRTRPPCDIPQTAKDREWIPEVAQRGWVAITRDADIQSHLSLLQLVQEYGLRLITLSGKDALGPWQQLEVLMPNWRRIEEIYSRQGPLLFAASRTALRQIDIEKSIAEIREGRAASPKRRQRSGGGLALFD